MVGIGRKREACRAPVQESDAQSLARHHRRLGMMAMAVVRRCLQRLSAVQSPGDAPCPGSAKRRQWGAGPLLAGALVAWPAVGSEAASWDLVKHEQDLVIYATKVPGSDVVAFKGRGVIHQPVVKVAAVLLDGQHAREWVGHLEASQTVRRLSPTESMQYTHIGTPFVMKDRDVVVRITIDVLPEKRAVHVHDQSTAAPLAPLTDYVRGEISASDFLLTALEPHTTMVLEATMHADPQGAVPKWIVNLFQKSWPGETFRAMQKRVERPDLPAAEGFEKVLNAIRDYEPRVTNQGC